MATQLQRGFALLNRVMEPAAAESVRYIRGATVISDELPALLSAQLIEQISEGGPSIVGRQFTWRLKRDELRWDNAPTKPRRSDRIEWVHGGTTYQFEVVRDVAGAESPEVDPRSEWIPANVKLLEGKA